MTHDGRAPGGRPPGARPSPSGPPLTVARATTPHGEVALRRRGDVLELVVDGAFAMDTVDTSSEVALSTEGLRRAASPTRVLVGGLGLGFTARAVLADPRVGHIDVVELAEPLVRWAREGVTAELDGIQGTRCTLHHADVADVLSGLAGPAGPWDVVLLDVDNGPGFLVHLSNGRLYAVPGLRTARAALTPGGVLVVWSSHVSAPLLAALRRAALPGDDVVETVLPVTREGRSFEYALYSLVRGDAVGLGG